MKIYRRILPLFVFLFGFTVVADRVSEALDTRLEERRSSEPKIDRESSSTERAGEAEGEFYDFEATAYCLQGLTASGVPTRPGIVAADPKILPIGTVVHIKAGPYSGRYTVLDTGGLIKGRTIDIYVPTLREAINFGRRPVKLKVIHSTRPRVALKSRRGARR